MQRCAIAMTTENKGRGGVRSDRRHWKSFRLSEEELFELEEKARAAGVTVSDLIRDEILDGTSIPKGTKEDAQ